MPLQMEFPSYHKISAEKILQSISDVVFVIDLKGVFQYVSPSCIHLLGYKSEEMTGKHFQQFIHPEDVEKTVQFVRARKLDGKRGNFENRYFHKDGSSVRLLWAGRWDETDQLYYCVTRDGTDKWEIQDRLHKAQQIAKVANYEYDVLNQQYTYTSENLYHIFGIDREKHGSFTTDLFRTLLHPEDRKLVSSTILQQENIYSSTLEFRILRPDGKVVYINRIREVVGDALGQPVKIVGTLQDITERKISELALQQSEERFRSLVQNGNDMIGILDANGNYSFIGDNVRYHLGYHAAELVGQNALSFIHPEDVLALINALQDIQNNISVTINPFRFKNKNGEWRWIESRVSNHLEDPVIRGIVINSRDITEKKLQDDELNKLSMIARETNNPVIIQDMERRVLWVNNAFIKLTGYALEECVGKHIGEICDGPETDPKVIQYVQQQVARCASFRIETLNYKKNGDTYWSDVSCQPMFNEKGEVIQYLSVATDITARKQLEKQLELEQKNRHIKITAATLRAQEHERSVVSQELHDNVNQVLTTVKLYIEMCRDGFSIREQLLNKSIQLLQDSITEIRSLSKRLSAPSLGKIRLSESIKDLVTAVTSTHKFEVILETDKIEQLEVDQDVHLAIYRILQEHLTNILKHADAHMVHIRLHSDVRQIHLSVHDDGKGFDPSEKTSGIGIANMITRAESLQGSFHIKSAPGEGCDIQVRIPLKKPVGNSSINLFNN